MVASLFLYLAACGPNAAPAHTTTLTVLAASSLTDAFTELERDFEDANPHVDVVLSFAGSQTLSTQLRNGLKADVVASANAEHLQKLAGEGLVLQPRVFAHNRLVLAVRSDAATHIDLEHLGEAQRIVLGAPEVPVGAYTQQLFSAAQAEYGDEWRDQVDAHVVSREPSARLVLAKVVMGEADAAVVYATDAAGREVRTVAIPPELTVVTADLHAQAVGAADTATTWLDFVESSAGQKVLKHHGFEPAE